MKPNPLAWGSLDGPKPDNGSWAKKQVERNRSNTKNTKPRCN